MGDRLSLLKRFGQRKKTVGPEPDIIVPKSAPLRSALRSALRSSLEKRSGEAP